MSILCDQHLHTAFSSDSKAAPELMIEKAISLGLKCICITDHMDLDFPENEDGYTFQFDTQEYFKKMRLLKEQYQSKIDLHIGVELGIMPTIHDLLEDFMREEDDGFDFVIASTHLVDRIDPYYPEYFDTHGYQRGIEKYFESILEDLEVFHQFDVYGHLDYVVRYAKEKDKNYNPIDFKEYIDAILKKIISLGKAIEVNTAGLKAGLSNPHPHPEILKRYLELGGEYITIGSDAHMPCHIGYEFKRVEELLRSIGFRYYACFEQRKPQMLKF